MTAYPRFDFWVCQGRLCTSAGSDGFAQLLTRTVDDMGATARVRILRGGCYGLCDLAANLVVRRYAPDEPLPDSGNDRLSLTEADNEFVYCTLDDVEVVEVARAHLERDSVYQPASRAVREAAPATTPIESRMRALRQRRSLAVRNE